MSNTPTNHKNSLSAKDIDIIIRACKKAGVSHIKYENLVISFEIPEKTSKKMVQTNQIYESLEPFSPIRPGDGGIPVKEERNDQDDLAELLISDPLAYEEELEKRLIEAEG